MKVPGISQLAKDYQFDYIKVSSFFDGNYRDWTTYRKKAEDVQKVKRSHRVALADVLLSQNEKFYAGEQTFENIKKLKETNTLVVATGQQVGLFTGPLYTIYKALTTIKLAQELSTKLGTAVVPVFYIVSEDHDFAEVQWAGFINKKNNYTTVSYDHPNKEDRLPVADIKIEKSIIQRQNKQ